MKMEFHNQGVLNVFLVNFRLQLGALIILVEKSIRQFQSHHPLVFAYFELILFFQRILFLAEPRATGPKLFSLARRLAK